MDSEEFNQLDGKLDALAYLLCHVIAELENQLKIDGPVLSENLRQSADAAMAGGAMHPVMALHRAEALSRLADSLDAARRYRENIFRQ